MDIAGKKIYSLHWILFFFFMVLELYCRKVERKREGRERPAMATWREGETEGPHWICK
jgi:hypothetical protein